MNQIVTAFKSNNGIDPTAAFNQGFFGAVQPNEMYHGGWTPMGAIDRRQEIKSALAQRIMELKGYSGATSGTAGGAGTAGLAFLPAWPSMTVTDRSRKLTPFVELTSRVANNGLYHPFNYVSSKDSAVFAPDGGTVTDQSFTGAQTSVTMKFMYARGKVTGPRQAAQPAYMLSGTAAGMTGTGLGANPFGSANAPNAMQFEILTRTQALKELEENKFWNGDTDSDANEFNGIIDLQSTTNKVDKNTTDIEYDDLETMMQYAYDDSGYPTVAGCGTAVLTDVRKILRDHLRYTASDMISQLPFGIQANVTVHTTQGPLPIIPSQYLSNVTGSKCLYALDMTEIYFAVLQDATYEKLDKTQDWESFHVKQYEGLIMRAPQFNAFIGEIK
jgi:hypothetical protein